MNWIEVEGKRISENIILAKEVRPLKINKEAKLRVLAFDIEMAEENGEEKIIMISFVDNHDFKKVITQWKGEKTSKHVELVIDEKSLLERFVQIIKEQNPDFIITFNGDNFDFPKIRERSEKFKISLNLGRDNSKVKMVRRGRVSSAKIHGRVHIDLYGFIDHILSTSLKTEILTLDAVATELLGLKKRDLKWKDIQESWKTKNGLKQLADYCLWDSELTLKLANQLLPQIFALSRLTGVIPFDVSRYYYSQLDEAYLMRKAFEQNILIPNNPKQNEIRERRMKPAYEGGFVIEPKKGIHSNIIVLDFRSLYPTIILSHNISPDTINCSHKQCKKNKPEGSKSHFCEIEREKYYD
jgi:DNA polymerase I/DNA polymerase-2